MFQIPRLAMAGLELAPPCRYTHEWLDTDGRLCAYGDSEDGRHWIHCVGTGTYHFGDCQEEVLVSASGAASWELLQDTYLRSVLPLVLQARGMEVLHASAVRTHGGVLGLCARSGTGKSTLVYGLHQRGYSLWADDSLAFEGNGMAVGALPLPFTIRLTSESEHYFGGNRAGETHESATLAPLCMLCALDRLEPSAGERIMVTRLSPSEAFLALLTHAYCFSVDDGQRKHAMMRHYLDLTALVPVYSVRFKAGLENLPAVLDALERLVH